MQLISVFFIAGLIVGFARQLIAWLIDRHEEQQ